MTGAGVLDRQPIGWYRVADRVTPGEVHPFEALGVDLVAWVTADGVPHAADAHCPHLGAHLGHGGCVDDRGGLRCHFHGWRYGPDGANLATSGEGPAVPAAALRSREAREVDGALYVFTGVPSDAWGPTAFPAHADGDPQKVVGGTEQLTAHQQVVLEGDFDAAHFGPVHGQRFVAQAASFDGPTASIGYTTEGRRPQTVEIRLDGLSRMWQRTKVGEVTVGLRVDYRTVARDRSEATTEVSVWAPTERHAERTLERMERVLVRDIARDAMVWEHRRYDDGDRLGPDDRNVAAFRRWARQFHPDD